MNTVQNYVAPDICNRPNIGVAIKGSTSTVPPRRLLFCIALFIFSGVITVRHQRSWCGAAVQGCIFSNVSSDTRLRQSFIFATYIALVKIKKKTRTRSRDVDEGPGCKKLYRRPRECHFKELWDLVILLPRGPPCSTSGLVLAKRSALNLSVRGISVWESSSNNRINRCFRTLAGFLFFPYMCVCVCACA